MSVCIHAVILGPPGAGKGTHAERIRSKYGILHISTGDMLRDAVSANTPLGREARKFMDQGTLVPDDTVIALVKERLSENQTGNGFLLDGFPRTRAQAEGLEKMLGSIGKTLKTVVYLRTSRKVILARLTGRRVCEGCGKIYNIPNFPPKRSDICDDCGKRVVQRKDDEKKTVLKRLDVYDAQTKELIDYYRDRKLLVEVPGDKGLEEVQEEFDVIFQS